MTWNNSPPWMNFNLLESIKAGQSVTANLFNAIVNNLQVLKQREG